MLKLENISKSYGGQKVLEALDLEVEQGEVYCLLGPSGAGKSTLLHIIAGTAACDSGTIELEADRIGYVFQEDRLLPWLSVEDNIRVVNDTLSDVEVRHFLEEMDLSGSLGKKPDELSGGMRQRVSIARAFAYKPDLLLLDEPFKSLDYSLKAKMIESLLRVWRETRITVLFVTHDIDEALWTADRIGVLGMHPKGLKNVIEVPNPRKLNEAEFNQLKTEILNYWEENI
jgi:NitT/TauT family transport system ATP-binding protein